MPQAEAPPVETPPIAESLPPPAVEGTIPLAGSPPPTRCNCRKTQNGLITLIVRDASLSQVLALFAQQQSLNIVAANDIDALISITLCEVPLEEALTAILSVANYTWVQRNNIILITSLADPTLPADVQDRQIQVFELDFASAQVVAEAVTNFLSPIGKVSISASDPGRQPQSAGAGGRGGLAGVAGANRRVHRAGRLPAAAGVDRSAYPAGESGRHEHARRRFRCAVPSRQHSPINIFSVPSLNIPLPDAGVPTRSIRRRRMVATLTAAT